MTNDRMLAKVEVNIITTIIAAGSLCHAKSQPAFVIACVLIISRCSVLHGNDAM